MKEKYFMFMGFVSAGLILITGAGINFIRSAEAASKNLSAYEHEPNNYDGKCNKYFANNKGLTIWYRYLNRDLDTAFLYPLEIISNSFVNGRGIIAAEYGDWKINGEYSLDTVTWKAVDAPGHVIELIGGCTEFGIAGWMGYTERKGDNAWEYNVLIFNREL